MDQKVVSHLEEAYRALRQGVGFARLDRGIIRLTGNDRIDLLHRLSTADMARLSPGQAATTIITSEKGRVVDLLELVAGSDDLLAISSWPDPADTMAWIEKYTIMDDVQSSDVSGEFGLLGVYGDRAFQLLDSLVDTGGPPPAGAYVRGEIDGQVLCAWRGEGLNGPSSLYLLGPVKGVDALVERLESEGGIAIGDDLMEVIRIEAGRPRAGSELGLQHNPLELGLVSNVSFTKGCYIGQEVIARLDSYDKVKNRLVGLRVQEEVQGEILPEAPVRSTADQETIGRVTSVADSPGIGTIALGLLRATHANPDTPIEILDPASREVVATGLISMLPFAT